MESQTLADKGVFLDPLLQLYDKFAKRSYHLAQTLVGLVSGGLFMNSDLFMLGYDIDPCCKHCGAAMDSVYHQCFTCPFIESRAKLALGDALFNKIIGAGPDSLLATRCLAPVPCTCSVPSKTTIVNYVNFGAGEDFHSDNGSIFGGGSCFHPN